MREDPGWVKAAAAHVHYRLNGMEEVSVRRDIEYKSADDEPLLFDLYQSNQPAPNGSPCVILIHGGPLPSNLLTTPKDWGWFQSIGRLVGASGMSAIVLNHRFFGLEQAAAAQADVRDLVDYVREHSQTLGVDRDRLGLWTFSGGGIFLSSFLVETPTWLCAAVAYYSARTRTIGGRPTFAELGQNSAVADCSRRAGCPGAE